MIARTLSALTIAMTLAAPAYAQDRVGVTDDEIKLGQTMSYSGPASAYGVVGKVHLGYFQMLNENGGIHGRKINLMSLDDGFSPPKTVEATRRLVEQEKVLAMFGSTGSSPNSAVQPYLNQNGVPHIVGLGADRFADPEKFPWSISLFPSYDLEGRTFAKYALATKPEGKIAILYQNDDAGRDLVAGFKRELGDKTGNIVLEAGYDISEPTIRAQIAQLHASGADTLFVASIPKFTAQAIREVTNLQWKPLFLLASMGSSVDTGLAPAGLENAVGIVSTSYFKTISPATEKDDDVVAYKAFVEKYVPEAKPTDWTVGYSYVMVSLMEQVLRNAGPDIDREKLREAMTGLDAVTVPMLLPGITVSSAPDNYHTFDTVRLQEFDGKEWQLLDDIIE